MVMKKLKDMGVDDNTIVVFTTDNGTEVFTWPDGGQTPFAQSKGTIMEGGFRVPPCFAGPDTGARRTRFRTASSPAWTGSRPSWPPRAIPTSPMNCSRARRSATGPTRNHLDGYNQMADHRQRAVRASRNLLSR